MAQKLSQVNKLERLSPLVYRVLGCNPGSFTLQGTNTYIVGNGKDRLLIDTGEPNKTEYTTNLQKVLQEENANISTIVCTHWHHDHVGGMPDILEKVLDKKPLKLHKLCHTNDTAVKDITKYAPHGFEYLTDQQEIAVDGATLRVVHTPGHTADHIVLHLLQENAVFSGDCVLGEGTTVFEDLHTYMQSLQVLLALNPTTIYPGHGPVVSDPIAKVTEYITHRNQREEQILQCLAQKPNISIVGIVQHVYPDLPLMLQMGAGSNVRHHLDKLIKEEKVVESNNVLLNTFALAKPKL